MSDLIHISYDIETAANDRAKHYFSNKKYKAPANWKDPAKIEEYVTTARHEDMAKAALHWWTGRVVCVSLRWLTSRRAVTIVGPDEKLLLCQLFDLLEAEPRRPVLIGKEGDVFDRPFLLGRALALDTGIPTTLRPYRPVEDINHIFGFGSRAGQIGKLDDYAFGLGIEGKTGNGNDVQTWVAQAELGDATAWQKIGNYCARDVDIVDEMYRRWLKPYTPRKPQTTTPQEPRGEIPLEDIPFGSSPSVPVVVDDVPPPADSGDFG